MTTFKYGDIVTPKSESSFFLRSGCSWYKYAIVLETEPFALVSEESDMLWTATIKPEYFTKIGTATQETMDLVERRRPDLPRKDIL